MKFKKLYAAALAAGICFVSAAAPVSAAIVAPDGTVGNGWAPIYGGRILRFR